MLSTKQIAAEISSSRTSLSKYLKLYKIPIRPNDIAHKSRSQLGYGEAWRSNRMGEHKRELAALEKMRKLRAEDFL